MKAVCGRCGQGFDARRLGTLFASCDVCGRPLHVRSDDGRQAHHKTPAQRARIQSDDRQPDLFLDRLRDEQFAAAARQGDKAARYEAGKGWVRLQTKAPERYESLVKRLARILPI